MPNKWRLRGVGFKHTLSAVFPFAAVWVLVVVLTAPVIILSMMAGGLLSPAQYSEVWFFLLTRMPVLALAAIGLGIFTTSRAAGPLVALRVAIEGVARGDMERRLQLRRSDRHFREIEVAFNEMMESLNERMTSPESSEAEDWDPDSGGQGDQSLPTRL